MFIKRIIPLAMIATVGASTAALAAQMPANEHNNQIRQHSRHVVLQRKHVPPAYDELEWNLPQGWPYS